MIADGTEQIAEKKKDNWELVSPPSKPAGAARTEGLLPVPGAGYHPGEKMVARIVRAPEHQVWLYGVHLAEGVALPPFPELAPEDLDILQPLPSDSTVMDEGPFKGWSFVHMATRFEAENFCGQALQMALRNEPMSPYTFKLAFYLFGRVKIAYDHGHRMIKDGKVNENKRPSNPDDMKESRTIQVPIRYDPYDHRTLDLQECQVMMTEDATPDFLDAFAVNDEDPPGLAILDSGCTRTMHGTKWAEKFEQELMKIPLCPRLKQKRQLFRGIGGDIESNVVKVFPVGIGHRNGELHSAEVPGNNPMLISRPFMQKLGTIINIGDGTVTFELLGVRDLPLRRTAKGHLAVSLLDFEAETVDIYDHLHENEEKIEGDTSDEECAGGLQAVVDLPEPQQSQQLPEKPYPPRQNSDASWERVSSTSREERANPTPKSDQENEVDETSPSPSYYEDGTYHRNSDIDRMDWEDQQEELQFWRMLAQDHIPPEDRVSEGYICEDYDHFEKEIDDGFFTMRKASSRKAKKISAMNAALEGDDVLNYHTLRGSKHPVVKKLPPFGKTWIKQIYAGAMGITTLAVMFGMSIGVPLDIEISGWDGGTAAGKKQLHNDLMVEDPYCLILTQPCGPWGNWSRFNLAKGGSAACTVQRLREDGRAVLRSVNKTIRDRVRAGRHVFMEQPLGSQSINEPEMGDVKKMVEDGTLCLIVVDGCMVGYKDKESGLPHKKPSFYVTTLLCAESVFGGCQCDGNHQHQPLEGNNKYGSRTHQAAEWPADLNKMVLDAVIQQASVELESSRKVGEAYPAEVRPAEQPPPGERRPKRAKGRMGRLGASQSAPPVYIRPDDPLSPQPQPSLSSVPPLDSHGFRAAQAEELDPVLSMNEGERRHLWLQVDADLRKLLRDLHVQFGHPTTTTLQRILRRQGAKAEVIKAASLMSCDACGDTMRQKRPRPVKLPPRYQFNFHLQADVFYAKDNRGRNLGFLNIICDATSFQVVACLGEVSGTPASQVVLQHFLACWTSWAGLPHSLQVDRGKEFMARFADYLKEFGVEHEAMPLEAPWKNGKCERAGGLWKEVWDKTVIDADIHTLQDAITATSIVTQTRNSFPRSNGYAPNQWVLGIPEVRLPGSLLDSDESQQLEVLEAAENPSSAMAKNLAIREAARVSQIRLDTDSRVRRALLRKSTPVRGPYPIGAYVYFYRRQVPRQVQEADSRNYTWYGPARVIGVELRNPRRLEDPEGPTSGAAPHSYWLRYGPSVVLASGEQLRFASEDELLAAHYIPHYALERGSERGARNYVDIRNQLLTPQQLSGGGVDADFWEVHPDRVVRVHYKARKLLFNPVNQGCPVPLDELKDERITEVIYGAEMRDHVLLDSLKDNWRAPESHRELRAQWTGETIFYRKNTSTTPSTTSHRTSSLPTIHEQAGENPVQEERTGEDENDAAETPFPTDGFEDNESMGQPPSTAEPEPQPAVPHPSTPQPQVQPQPLGAMPADRSLSSALSDPNRLDGYGPMRRVYECAGPYLVEENDWLDGCEDLAVSLKNKRLKRLMDDEEDDEEELHEEAGLENPHHEAMLTGRAVKSEVNLKDLSQADREKFDVSMAKEWASFQKFNAVEVLTEKQIKELPNDVEIVSMRWVHTDKNQKPRLLAMAMSKKAGKSKKQIEKDYPFEAKSRMVVQGNQENNAGIRSDSPTGSLLAFNFVTAISVMKGWVIEAYDASTAYLQSQGISRLLLLRPPRPPPPGITSSDLFRAKGSIYGTRDAGRSWWRKLFNILKSHGWKMSKLEAALFYLYEDEMLVGALVTHVDDLYCTGVGKKYEGSMSSLEKEIYLKKKSGEFRFCGKNVKQNVDGSISLDQMDAIESLDYMVLRKERRSLMNAPLTEEEKTGFRALIGSLGWIARQTRPDVLVNVSLASQTMGAPHIKDVIELNKVVKMLKDSCEFKWNFVKHKEMELDKVTVVCMSDSSWANTTNLKSQCGYVIGLTLPTVADGGSTPMLVLETYSGSIKRVCRSTLASETNGFLSAVEAADYLRMLLLEVLHPGVCLLDLDEHYKKSLLMAFTDAKSLESTLNRDAGQPTDKRVKILLAQVREFLGQPNYDDDDDEVRAYWVDTAQMVADVLTKAGCEREPLLDVLSRGCWQLQPSKEALLKKQHIREGRHRRKMLAKSNAEDGCEKIHVSAVE